MVRLRGAEGGVVSVVAKRAVEKGLMPAQLKAATRYRSPVARFKPTSLKDIGGGGPPMIGITGVVSLFSRTDELVLFINGKSTVSKRDHTTVSALYERVLVSSTAR